jgi:hypothetical protein
VADWAGDRRVAAEWRGSGGIRPDPVERLRSRYGQGFSITNLRYFRLFYQAFSDRELAIHNLPGDELQAVIPRYAGTQYARLRQGTPEPALRQLRVYLEKGPLWEGRHSEDQLQNHPTVHDKRHEEAQHAAQNHRCDLAVLDLRSDEHEALDRENRGSQDR